MGVLNGKVAVVTGAGRGIGRGEAHLMAAEGASVVVNDVGGEWDGQGQDTRPAQQVVDELEAAGAKAAANYDDISTWSGAESLVRQAIETFGGLDIVVNNAGILRDAMIFNMTEENWDAVVKVHMKGHASVTHHACAYWRGKAKAGETTSGRIINTSSEAGLYGLKGQGNYAAAKAGIASLTQVTAREMKKYNVTANCIAPRARTRLITNTFGDTVMAAPEQGFDVFAPENVAPLVTYLASDASAHISGQVFVVMGGLVQLMKPWEAGPSIDNEATWDVETLAGQIDKLFDGAKSSPE
ncbi:MAG: SDR family oxidoreductase [Actinomycetota bacterium]|nr:SDR family NAD(P)-dependent oxidoreductase [Actinomycetota bacterium]